MSLPHVTVTHSSNLALKPLGNTLHICVFCFASFIFHFFISSSFSSLFITLNQPCSILKQPTNMFYTFTFVEIVSGRILQCPHVILYSVGVRDSMVVCVGIFRHLCLFFVVSVWSLTSFTIVRYYLCVMFAELRQPRGNDCNDVNTFPVPKILLSLFHSSVLFNIRAFRCSFGRCFACILQWILL